MDSNTYNPFSLEGKTILVTGASAGIGKSIAVSCSKMGACMVLTGRNKERLAVTLSECWGEGHMAISADLNDAEQIEALTDKVPPLYGVVYCAGVGHRMPCKMLTAGMIDEVMDVNFKSDVLLQASLLNKKKIRKGASLVFIASRAASSPSIGNALYSASKGALISYARCLALEMAPRLIRVNCICPAMVWTDLIYKGGLTKEYLEEAQQKYPLKRFGQPEDVANLSIYLLSDASSWMTGTCVDLTGGGE